MTTTRGSVITITDVNNLIDTIQSVYAVGAGDTGYGQSIYTLSDVTKGKKITSQDWSMIRGMLLVCSSHQGTVNSTLFPDPAIGVKVLSTTSAIALANACVQNRLIASAASLTEFDNAATGSYASNWNGTVQATVDISFATEDQARYFFNSGGVIKITLTQPNGSTAQDASFRNFLVRQLGSIFIGAHTSRISGTATAATLPNSGYYEFSSSASTLLTQVSTDSLSTSPDQIVVKVQRTNYAGLRGGNGSGFQIILQATCLGDAGGSVLTAGTSIEVDTIQATTYLTVAAPNCAVGGFHQISAGAGTAGGGDGSGGVQIVPPYSPDPGTVTYTVPEYATITFELMGGGGSQASSTGPYPRGDADTIFLANGTDGGDATITALGLVAKGGKGGSVYDLKNNVAGAVGADGVGTGGDVNTPGGGGAGGSGAYAGQSGYLNGSAGGAGAYVKKTYVRGASGAPNPGDILVLTIPTGGSQAGLPIPTTTPPTVFFPGTAGTRGQVKVTVTNASTGSVSFKTPGTYQFKVPSYSQITFDVNGAGGGQGHPFNEQGVTDYFINGIPTDMINGVPLPDGSAGGASSIPALGLFANGGAGGTYIGYKYTGLRPLTPVPGYDNLFSDPPPIVTAEAGANGTAAGGQQNIVGGGASGGYILYFGDPVAAAQGPAANKWHEGANGGNGGRAISTFNATDTGAPTAGTVLNITVGAGGAPAPIQPFQYAYGTVYASGDNGFVTVSWSGSATTVDTPV